MDAHLLLPGFEQLFVFPLCYQLALFIYPCFYFSFTAVTSCNMSFSSSDTQIGLDIFLVLTLVWSSPQFQQTAFRLHLVFVAIVTYQGSVFALVYSGILGCTGSIGVRSEPKFQQFFLYFNLYYFFEPISIVNAIIRRFYSRHFSAKFIV